MESVIQKVLRSTLGVELRRVKPITNPKVLPTRLNESTVQRRFIFMIYLVKLKKLMEIL